MNCPMPSMLKGRGHHECSASLQRLQDLYLDLAQTAVQPQAGLMWPVEPQNSWLIFHWLSISRNCLDVIPQYVSWVFHGFRKHLKLQDYMWAMLTQVNCGAFSVFWLEQWWSEEQREFLRNFTKMELYWWIAKCCDVGRFSLLQRRRSCGVEAWVGRRVG